MTSMTICCADIGSVKRKEFGWAAVSGPDRKEDSGSCIVEFAEFVGRELEAGAKVSLGFECPLWIPVAEEPCELTRARGGEGNRPWSAGAGSGSLATGLAEVSWILDRIRQETERQEHHVGAFLDWNLFQRVDGGLFIWEAFVTGEDKTASDEGDAQAAVRRFRCALSDPPLKSAVNPSCRTCSLIGAALLWAGWSDDIGLLKKPCIVIR